MKVEVTKEQLEIQIIQCNIKIAEHKLQVFEQQELVELWKKMKEEKEEKLKSL